MIPIGDALTALGVRRLLLAIHDASFPADADDDLGRGSPATRAAARLFAFARALGFTGIQLGPSGQTSRDNASPYDATIFSRHLAGIAPHSFAPGGPFDGLVDAATLARAVDAGGGPIQHARAHDASCALIAAAHAAHIAGARPDLAPVLARFLAEHSAWLVPDMRYAAVSARYGGACHRDWHPPDQSGDSPLSPADAAAAERHAFGQLLAHLEHARVRLTAASHGLALYGDLQVGYSDADAWAYRDLFLRDYVMGAPPSRTNPEGQPWGYPVLDPAQPAAEALIARRADKAFSEYDSLRIDHPHGLICPWVYRAHSPDPGASVRAGARLHESPDLAALSPYAIARASQLDHTLPRHHDAWVRDLDDAQVARYARWFDILAAAAARHHRALADLSCEVLSTMPLPLGRVLARHNLGRWRVLQKANLDDPLDVYRSETAAPADWVMLGNHDTPSIFALLRSWPTATRDAWCRHLTSRLALPAATSSSLAHDDGLLAAALLASLLCSRAENVSIFFADLFGYTERFNQPGTYTPHNWSLRLPPDFDRLYRDRLAQRAALDLSLAISLASAAPPLVNA